MDCRLRRPKPVLVSDSEGATHLYRIAQEAVSNAIRHGRARRISIGLRQWRDRITLRISDNGKGIGVLSPRKEGDGAARHAIPRQSAAGARSRWNVARKAGLWFAASRRCHDGTVGSRRVTTENAVVMSKTKSKANPKRPGRILIVDDHPIVREGLVQHFNREKDLMVCGQASNASQAVAAVVECQPDLVLVDSICPAAADWN